MLANKAGKAQGPLAAEQATVAHRNSWGSFCAFIISWRLHNTKEPHTQIIMSCVCWWDASEELAKSGWVHAKICCGDKTADCLWWVVDITHDNRVYTSLCVCVATLNYKWHDPLSMFACGSDCSICETMLHHVLSGASEGMCCRHFASTHDENPAHWQYFTKAHRQKDGNGSHSAGKVVGDILCIFLCLILYSITQLFSANEPGHDALYTGSEHSRHLPNVATFLSFSILFTALLSSKIEFYCHSIDCCLILQEAPRKGSLARRLMPCVGLRLQCHY